MAALKERLIAIRQQIAPGGPWPKRARTPWASRAGSKNFCKTVAWELTITGVQGRFDRWPWVAKTGCTLAANKQGLKVAAIASIVETCRRRDINLRTYLRDVRPGLGQWPINRVAELTPTTWKAAQKS